jgi:hypothetical protein
LLIDGSGIRDVTISAANFADGERARVRVFGLLATKEIRLNFVGARANVQTTGPTQIKLIYDGEDADIVYRASTNVFYCVPRLADADLLALVNASGATDAWLRSNVWAVQPDGTATDGNGGSSNPGGALLNIAVLWPDGTTGTLTAVTYGTAKALGAINKCTVTYGTTKIVTVEWTRDNQNGFVYDVPANITVGALP